MKTVVVVFLALAAFGRADDGYSPRIRHVIEQIREEKTPDGKPFVSGRAEGYGGSHGAFFLLGPYVCARATKEDVALMLKDASPVIRILAAKRISMRMIPMFRPEAMDSLLGDEATVYVGPLDEESDAYRSMTVAEVVRELQKHPHFLPLEFYYESDKPNQSLEPTSVLGTSAAEPPRVPSTLVAHL